MALPPAGGRNKKDRLRGLFFSCGFSEAPTGLPVKGCGARGLPPPLASRQSGASELRPPTSCLPCVRGGAERMRSGGVVGAVQEKVTWYWKPVPIRDPQPLSQGLPALPAPLTQGSQAPGGRRFPAEGAKPCEGQPAHQKAALSFLTKRLRGAIVVSVRTAAIAGGGRPSMSFQLEGNAAYRYGGRLFLMSEGRYDQRRKTDEHQRVCKHIRVSYHIAHPPFDRGRFCGNAIAAPRSGPRAI